MNEYITSALIGSIVGTLSGWIGISGSIYIEIALLLTGLSKTQSKAAGTTMFIFMFPIVLPAVYEYYKRGDVDIYSGLIMGVFYMLLSGRGAKINKLVSQENTFYVSGITTLLASFLFFYLGYKNKGV